MTSPSSSGVAAPVSVPPTEADRLCARMVMIGHELTGDEGYPGVCAIIASHTRAAVGPYEEWVRQMRDALEACGVCFTPLERHKGWNEFKEDASQRRRTALNLTLADCVGSAPRAPAPLRFD